MKTRFGETLRNLRKTTGKSQIEVANEITKMFNINMSQASLSTLEQRENIPRQQLIEILAAYYEVSIGYFVDEDTSEEDAIGTGIAIDYIRALRDGKLPISGKKAYARSEGNRRENDDIAKSLDKLTQNFDEDDIF